MKALILSLVIAFSSSFALALACNKPDASFGSHEGAYTKSNKVAPVIRVGGNQNGAQVK